jgi:hypothetical protein
MYCKLQHGKKIHRISGGQVKMSVNNILYTGMTSAMDWSEDAC